MKSAWLVLWFALLGTSAHAQSPVPVIRFDSIPDPLKLPNNI